ncbi:MAG TPA: hypothetical protein VFI96_04200 [Longimicrobiaceae bacterium]|nr:hypothetical protein [Longimicrobiaceae bacterium]
MNNQYAAWPAAPSDAAADAAWAEIMALASQHCLIVAACGGTATLATPHAQREHGVRDKVLRMEQRVECPETGEVLP